MNAVSMIASAIISQLLLISLWALLMNLSMADCPFCYDEQII